MFPQSSEPEPQCIPFPVPDPDLHPCNIKNTVEYKSQKRKQIENEMTTFWETMVFLTVKKQDVQIFLKLF
jgi:hypothetical protein